ncbi:MAG: DUF2974 domain-containing protein [Ruminococcaceae bacterium]|nr:DUF2974 domain-containing protein [Oscillospiraceae bacterium]
MNVGNLYDYLKWRGDLSFSEAPINDVDSLIFSLISYLDLKDIVPATVQENGIPLKTAANAFFAKHPNSKKVSLGVIVPKGIITLFRAVKDTRRFRNVEILAYVNEIDLKKQMQFSAMTFILQKDSMLVAYRGTDDTLVGWKENFNMSFLNVVPSQIHATTYLNRVAKDFSGEVRVTGHSKGGNLAVYAAVHADVAVKRKLKKIWSNDGPGFRRGFLNNPAYIQMRPLIKTLVPQASLVGMLLEHEDDYTVVKSRQTGVLQHDGLSWSVMGGSFICLKATSHGSQRTDHTINDWIKQMSPAQREQFVEALYQVICSDNATTLTDLVSLKNKNKWLQKSAMLDPHVKKTIIKTLSVLFETNKKYIMDDIFSKK